MRTMRKYFLREVMAVFGVSLAVITVLFMSQRMIQLAEWAVNRGVGLLNMGKLLLYILPDVLLIVIPLVTLFSIVMAVGRWSADNEITALKSAGIGLHALLPPVVLFAAFAAGLSLLCSQSLIPASAHATRLLQWRVMQTRTEAAVTENTFIELLPDTTFYVREKEDDGVLSGVMAAQEVWSENSGWTSRMVMFAKRARFVHHPVLLINELWLEEGAMLSEDRESGRTDAVSFEQCRIRLDLGKDRAGRDDRRKELDWVGTREALLSDEPLGRNLKEDADERLKIMIQFHERLAWPMGCLALCFWALPLGIQPPRAGRARAIVVAVLLSALYYYLMVIVRLATVKGWFEPWQSLWLPDLFVTVTGAYMLYQKNRERPILVLSASEDYLYHLIERVKAWVEVRRGRS